MLTNKTWIYGWHLCDRWRYLLVQLAQAWRAGLPVYRVHDLAVQVPGQSCLECTCATAEGLPGCGDPDICQLDYPQYGSDSNGREVEYTFQIDDGQVGVRLFSYNYVFDLSEVEAFEQAHGLTIWTPAAQDQVVRVQEQGADPGQVETPAAFVARLRAGGVHDHHELALRVDREFTVPRYLSNLEIGRLLPADPAKTITDAGARDRGKRLRGKKK